MWHQGESRPAQWSIHVVLDRVGPVLHGPHGAPPPKARAAALTEPPLSRKSRTACSFSESSAGGQALRKGADVNALGVQLLDGPEPLGQVPRQAVDPRDHDDVARPEATSV